MWGRKTRVKVELIPKIAANLSSFPLQMDHFCIQDKGSLGFKHMANKNYGAQAVWRYVPAHKWLTANVEPARSDFKATLHAVTFIGINAETRGKVDSSGGVNNK